MNRYVRTRSQNLFAKLRENKNLKTLLFTENCEHCTARGTGEGTAGPRWLAAIECKCWTQVLVRTYLSATDEQWLTEGGYTDREHWATFAALKCGVQVENSLHLALFPFASRLNISDSARDDLAVRIARLYLNGEAEKQIKYTFCFWSAKFLKQVELPTSTGQAPFLYSGIYRARIMKLAQACDRTRLMLAQAFLVAKSGCPIVSERMVDGSLDGLFNNTCKKESKPLPDWFREQCRRRIREIFTERVNRVTKDCNFADFKRTSALLPSMRACFGRGPCGATLPNPTYDGVLIQQSAKALSAFCREANVRDCQDLRREIMQIVRPSKVTRGHWSGLRRLSIVELTVERLEYHFDQLAVAVPRLVNARKGKHVASLGYRDTLGGLGHFQNYVWHNNPEIISIMMTPPEFVGYAEYRGRVVPLYDRRYTVIEELDRWLIGTNGTFDSLEGERDCPAVQPSPVREALKVRVITKGQPRLKYYGKLLQRYLWSRMSRSKCFELTGLPISSRVISELICRSQALISKPLWVSGDYKSATDLLSSKASECCWDELMSFLQTDRALAELGLSTLIHNKVYDARTRQWHVQQNGQYMGDEKSFVILCLVNFIGTAYSLECAFGRELTLNELESLVRVNGDDVLFPLPSDESECNYTQCEAYNLDYDWDSGEWTAPAPVSVAKPDWYTFWKTTMSSLGLEFSLGKNYVSTDFLVVNSRMFMANTLAEQVRFVKPGLLLGIGRVADEADDQVADEGPISRSWHCFDDCPEGMEEELRQLFLFYNSDTLRAMSHEHQSWFLPRYCGGLGLPKPPDFSIEKVSPIARRVMRGLCNEKSPVASAKLVCPGLPEFVLSGMQDREERDKQLGIEARIVPLSEFLEQEQYDRSAFSYSYFAHALITGYEQPEPKNNFAALCNRYRAVEPSDGLPKFDRVIFCSGVESKIQLDVAPLVKHLGSEGVEKSCFSASVAPNLANHCTAPCSWQ